MPELLRATIRSLRAHALRYGLTSLGILWGAFMLTFLSGNMEGTDRHFRHELQEMGPKRVWIFPGFVAKRGVGERGARSVELEMEDVERLAALHSVENASPNIYIWNAVVRGGGRTKLLHVWGVSERSQSIRKFEVERGRYLSRTDVERAARVAFIGPEAAERLFGRQPALGHRIQIEGVEFRVIGVSVAKHDQMMNLGGEDDESIVIPYTTAQRWLSKSDVLKEVIFEPPVREQTLQSIWNVREVVGLHHHFDPSVETALNFVNIHEALLILERVMLGFRIFTVFAGLTTLLVGAVGVMNIMLVVVGERTAEIGLRKAVGAPSRAIFAQFLAEATAISTLSAVAGAGLGVAAVQGLRRIAPEGSPILSAPWIDPFTAGVIALSLIAVAVTAGVVPALRAAQVPPAESLRAT